MNQSKIEQMVLWMFLGFCPQKLQIFFQDLVN